jgi:hypothetical protein
MICARCGGVMNHEEFFIGNKGCIPWWYEGWRCIHCGDIVDPLILLNRLRTTGSSKPLLLRARR